MAGFFEIVPAGERGWHLDPASEEAPLDIWACTPLPSPEPIAFRISTEGDPVDFYCTGYAAIPVVSRRVADVLESIAPDDIQRIPAVIEGQAGDWEVINVLACPDCIDPERSIINRYPPDHPEKPGQIGGVMRLIIDADRAGTHNVFRPKGWLVSLIVSETVKKALEAIGATGIEYWRATAKPRRALAGMEHKFFRLMKGFRKRWHVRVLASFPNGSAVDLSAYNRGQRIDSPRAVPLKLYGRSHAVDYSTTDCGVAVVSVRMAEVLESLASDDIERIPAMADGRVGEWEVINVLTCLDCIDYEESRIIYYPPDHPSMAGQPKSIWTLIIDPAAAKGHHIFVPPYAETCIVVSEDVKKALEEMHASGVAFWPATD